MLEDAHDDGVLGDEGDQEHGRAAVSAAQRVDLVDNNNAIENALRPFAIGRKNWLFSKTQAGARASANLYSLIETAKAHRLKPYAYLRHIFKQLPLVQTVDDIDALLPGAVKGGGL